MRIGRESRVFDRGALRHPHERCDQRGDGISIARDPDRGTPRPRELAFVRRSQAARLVDCGRLARVQRGRQRTGQRCVGGVLDRLAYSTRTGAAQALEQRERREQGAPLERGITGFPQRAAERERAAERARRARAFGVVSDR